MKVKLTVVSGGKQGLEIPFKGDDFKIGRDEGNHLRPKSSQIAGRHCALVKEEGSLVARDFSDTGTFVNGERIEGERKLTSGDRIKVGPLEFEVSLDYGLASEKRAKVKDIRDAAARAAEGPRDDEDDQDITSWLADDETTSSSRSDRAFSLDDIKVVRDESDDDDEADEGKGKKDKPKKMYGKLPKKEQESEDPKDTRDAAAEMLKQFWKK